MTRLWFQLILELFEDNGRLFSVLLLCECPAVVYIQVFFSQKIAYFFFVACVFENARKYRLTFLFEPWECSYWIRSVPVNLWHSKRCCCCHDLLLLASLVLDLTLEIILVNCCYHAMYITLKTFLHSTLAHHVCVFCVLLHNVLTYLNMHIHNITYNRW